MLSVGAVPAPIALRVVFNSPWYHSIFSMSWCDRLSTVYRLVQPGSGTSGLGEPTDPHPGKSKREKRRKGWRDGPKDKTVTTI